MTSDEYASLTKFKDLPLYDEHDNRCDTIDKVNYASGFTGVVCEADTLSLALEYLSRSDLVPSGGIRHFGDNGSTIFAYFWQKR